MVLFPELSDESRNNLEVKLLEMIPGHLKNGDYERVLSTSELISDLHDFVDMDLLKTLSEARKTACRIGIAAEMHKGDEAVRSKDYAVIARSARRIRAYAEELRVAVSVNVQCYELVLKRYAFEIGRKKALGG